MASVETEIGGTVVAGVQSPIRRGRQVATLQCLVASAERARQKLLVQSASRWGWETIVCTKAAEAEMRLAGVSLQLAFVDIEGSSGKEFRGLLTELANDRRVLVVVCGNEDDIQEEIWVRQLGAWFYLPGMQESGSLGLLCRDARTIVEQRQQLAQDKPAGGARSAKRSKV